MAAKTSVMLMAVWMMDDTLLASTDGAMDGIRIAVGISIGICIDKSVMKDSIVDYTSWH